MKVWTEEKVALLLELTDPKRQEKLSLSAIAERLGVTRGAVSGKLHRLGLKERLKSPPNHLVRAQKRRAMRALRQKGELISHRPKLFPKAVVEGLPPEEYDDGTGKRLEDLGPRECKWPRRAQDGSGWRFCAKPMASGEDRYCLKHKIKSLPRHLRPAAAQALTEPVIGAAA